MLARGYIFPVLTLMCVFIGCDEDNTQMDCAQVGGNYLASFTTPSCQASDVSAIVQQQNCTVTASISGFGQIRCTSQSNGKMPRISSCTETIELCTNQKEYAYTPTDDGKTFTFDVITRQTACTGDEGGTLVFRLQLKKQS